MMKEHLEDIQTELKEDEAVLVDVREKEEWDAGHVKGAQWIPLSELQNGVFPQIDKNRKLYLYCRSGRRVHPATELLKAMSYKSVVPLSEGFVELVANGFEKEE